MYLGLELCNRAARLVHDIECAHALCGKRRDGCPYLVAGSLRNGKLMHRARAVAQEYRHTVPLGEHSPVSVNAVLADTHLGKAIRCGKALTEDADTLARADRIILKPGNDRNIKEVRYADLAVPLCGNAPSGEISDRRYDGSDMSVRDLYRFDCNAVFVGTEKCGAGCSGLYRLKHRVPVGMQPTEGKARSVKAVAGYNSEFARRNGI